jgi:hypothetical protein
VELFHVKQSYSAATYAWKLQTIAFKDEYENLVVSRATYGNTRGCILIF